MRIVASVLSILLLTTSNGTQQTADAGWDQLRNASNKEEELLVRSPVRWLELWFRAARGRHCCTNVRLALASVFGERDAGWLLETSDAS